jgi:hypothetical protein
MRVCGLRTGYPAPARQVFRETLQCMQITETLRIRLVERIENKNRFTSYRGRIRNPKCFNMSRRFRIYGFNTQRLAEPVFAGHRQ